MFWILFIALTCRYSEWQKQICAANQLNEGNPKITYVNWKLDSRLCDYKMQNNKLKVNTNENAQWNHENKITTKLNRLSKFSYRRKQSIAIIAQQIKQQKYWNIVTQIMANQKLTKFFEEPKTTIVDSNSDQCQANDQENEIHQHEHTNIYE